MKKLSLAAIGCGGRTRTYAGLAMERPDLFSLTAAADPVAGRLEMVAALSQNPAFRRFPTGADLLAGPKLADVLIIGTQDDAHLEPCLDGMKKGYDILLEKPIATNPADILKLARATDELGRRVLVCHVLRYTPFYETVKRIVDSGELGGIVTLHASEGVGTWHQAHSYVRGHWAVTKKATPMIVAKSCHDMDIISWMMGVPCKQVASFGSLSYFHSGNAPAGAPMRCHEGCPAAPECPYDAARYFHEHKKWLTYVHPNPEASEAEAAPWLAQSPWGRCVFHCDSDAVDHQVVNLVFQNGATATFTMTAFDSGRNIEIMGTKATMRGGDFVRREAGCDIILRSHADGAARRVSVEVPGGGYDGHAGGDSGLVNALHGEMTGPAPSEMRSSLARSVQSHLMAFAAEEARKSGEVINLEEFEMASQM